MYSNVNEMQPVWRMKVSVSLLRTLKTMSVVCGIFLGVIFNHTKTWAAPQKVKVVVLSRTVKGIPSNQCKWLGRTLRNVLSKQRRLSIPSLKQINLTLYTTPLSPKARTRILSHMKQMRTYLEKAKKLYQVTVFPLKKRSSYAMKALLLADKEATFLPKIFEQSSLVKKYKGLMRDLYFYYGLAYMGLGQSKKAVDFIHKLVRLDPSFVPSQHKAPSDYVGAHGVVLNKLKSRLYTMKIDSVPGGAKVYHNRRFVGRAPVTLSNLMAGRHSIRITKMKYKVWERVANLKPQKLGKRRVLHVKIPLKVDPKSLTVMGIPLYDKEAVHSDDILDRLEQITSRMKARFLYVIEPQQVKKDRKTMYRLKVAIYRKGYRTIYYQTLSLGPSLSSSTGRLRTYSKKIRRQVTTKFFKKPKPIK